MSDPKTKLKTKEVEQVQVDPTQSFFNMLGFGGKPGAPIAFKVVTARVTDEQGKTKVVKARVSPGVTTEQVIEAFQQGRGAATAPAVSTGVQQKAPLGAQPQFIGPAPDTTPTEQVQQIGPRPEDLLTQQQVLESQPGYQVAAGEAGVPLETQKPSLVGEALVSPITGGVAGVKEGLARYKQVLDEAQQRGLAARLAAKPFETLAQDVPAHPETYTGALAGAADIGFGALSAASPFVPPLWPLAGIIGGAHLASGIPGVGPIAQGLMSPFTTTFEPESQVGQDVAKLGDIAANIFLFKKAEKALGMEGLPRRPQPAEAGTEFGATLFPRPEKGITKKELEKAKGELYGRITEQRMADMASIEGQEKYQQYRQLYKAGKKKEAFEIAQTFRGNPDMLMFQGRGGFAFGGSGKQTYVGKAGEPHFDMYMRTHAKGDAGKANDLVRNDKWVNGRVSDGGETVMLWGSPQEMPQQALSNTLLDLISQKKATKDATVKFSSGETLKIKDAIEGEFGTWIAHRTGGRHFPPGTLGATLIPLPDITTPEFVKRVKELGASIGARNFKDNGSTTDPLTGKPVTKGYVVSVFPDLTVKVKGKEPGVVDAAVQKFVAEHRDLINENPKLKIGTWFEEDSGQTWIDLVHQEKSAKAAERMGGAAGQKAAFHLEKGVELPTGGTGEMPPELANIPPRERIKRLQDITSGKATTPVQLADPAKVAQKLKFDVDLAEAQGNKPYSFVDVKTGEKIDDRAYFTDALPESAVTIEGKATEAQIAEAIAKNADMAKELGDVAAKIEFDPEANQTTVSLVPKLNMKDAARIAREQGLQTITQANKGTYSDVEVTFSEPRMEPVGTPAERLAPKAKEEIKPLTPEQKQYMSERLTADRPEYAAENVTQLYKGIVEGEQTKRGIQPIESVAKHEDAAVQRFVDVMEDPMRRRLDALEAKAKESGKAREIWYDEHGKFMDTLSEHIPELKDDTNRKAAAAIFSVVSNGQTVRAEIGVGIPLIKEFLRTGKFPDYDLKIGQRGKAMTETFDTLNGILDRFNGDLPTMMDWMFSKHSMKEMREMKPNYQQEMRGDQQYGAMVLGGKIGAYLLNKFGIKDVITKDAWFNRTWRAVMNSFKEKVNPYEKKMVLDDASQAAEKRVMDRAMFELADKLGVDGYDLQAIMWEMEKVWAEKYNPSGLDLGTHQTFLKEMIDNGELAGLLGKTGEAAQGAGEVPKGTGLQKGFSRGSSKHRAGAFDDIPTGGEEGTTFRAGLFPDITITDPSGKKQPLSKYAGSINIDRLDIPEEAKARLHEYAEKFKKEIETIVGETPLTHDEIINLALDAEPFKNVFTRKEQAAIASGVLKLRQRVAQDAKEGFKAEGASERMLTLQSVANFAGRLLNSFKIKAEGVEWGTRERIISKLSELTGNAEEIMRRAKGIDWNDRRQVDRFIRDYVKPTTYDILEEMRYIGLLSSPRTHVVNAFSNMLQVGFVAPATRAIQGGVDFMQSALTGKTREAYASEVAPYAKEAVKALPTAWRGAIDALVGKTSVLKPDFERLPTLGEAEKWYMKPIAKLNEKTRFITNALEASDIFFRTIAESGEKAALIERATKGGKKLTPELMKDIDQQAKDFGQYIVFRKALDPANKTMQGALLSKIDSFTAAFMQAAKHAPELRWVVPFVQTPMNIFKQGIEYSPAGFFTMKGAGVNKQLQFSKAMLGSIVASGAAMAIANTETTWDVPTSPSEKADFYAQGKIPYAVKIGNKWYQINKLGPLAYPIAMVMIAKHTFEDGGLGAIPAGILKFLGEQSYMQGMKNFTDALNDPERKAEQFFTQTGKQAIPLSSLLRWTNSFVDRVQRAPEGMVDRIFTDIPGLSKEVPARATPFGETAEKPDLASNLFNLSPISAGKEPENKIIKEFAARKIKVGIPGRVLSGELKLPQTQYQQFIKEVGIRAMEVFKTLPLDKMTDIELQDEVDSILNDIRKSVRDEMFGAEIEQLKNERYQREKSR